MKKVKSSAVRDALGNEQLIQLIFNSTFEGLIIFDSSLKVLEINTTARDILNVSRKIIDSHMSDIFPSAVSERLLPELLNVLTKGRTFSLDDLIVELSNAELHLNLKAVRAGSAVAVFINDLTEMIQKENDFKAATVKYHRTLEALSDKIHVINRDYEIIYNNQAFDDWLEKINWKVELEGKTIFEAFPFIEDRVKREYEEVFSSGKTVMTEEQTWVGDQLIVTETCKVPIFYDNQVAQIVTAIRDTTEHYRDKQALKKKAEEYRLLVENQIELVVKVDPEFHFTYVNPGYCETFGKTEEELLGNIFLPLVHEDDREGVTESLKSLFKPPYITQHEERAMTVRGWRWFGWHARGITDDNGKLIEIISVGRDITEQKQAEDALRQSERHLREILENVNLIAVTLDLDGNITFCNDYLLNLTGYTYTDVIGKNWFDLFLPGNVREKVRKMFRGFLANETLPGHYENDIMTFSNEKRLINWNNTILRDSEGNIIGTASIGEDVTEIHRSAEHTRTILQTSMDGFWLLDFNSNIKEVNDAYCRMVGYTRDEILKMKITDLEVQESTDEIKRHLVKLKKKGSDRFETQHRRKDGSLIDIEASVNIIGTHEELAFAFFRDISERKQAEQDIKASEERFRFLFENAPIAYQSLDEDGMILDINETWCTTLGYSKDEVVGRWFGDFLTEDMRDVFRERFPRFKSQGSIFGAEFEIVCKDGSIKIVSYDGRICKNPQGKFFQTHCVFSDITTRKKLDQELIRAEKLESIGTLAGGIAHDFNNILTAVIGNISLAKLDADESSELYDMLVEAEKASIRAKDLTQQLLTFSRGGAPVKMVSSICEVVRDAAKFALHGSNVRCDMEMPDTIKIAEIDKGQIGQVVSNLVINADQAMPEGGKIKIRCEDAIVTPEDILPLVPGNYIKVTVEDEGIGVPASIKDKIFDPFTSTKQKGSGLGLATAYSIIKNHNGHICLEPKKSSGTTVAFYLPASEKEISEISQIKAEPITGNGRILILDDEEMVRDLAQKVLTRLGYEVELSCAGEETIEKYKQAYNTPKAFDVVLMDLTIPGAMGGKEAIKHLMEIDPEVKAVVSSGYSNDPVMAQYKKYGFSGRVAKPYQANELGAVLKAVLK